MEFFCVKCRKKIEVSDKEVTTEDKGNRRLFRAKCPECSTKMAKFGKKA
jgi:DNA-directed RNA polymerase subunit RPC12/RpoP